MLQVLRLGAIYPECPKRGRLQNQETLDFCASLWFSTSTAGGGSRPQLFSSNQVPHAVWWGFFGLFFFFCRFAHSV